MTKYMSGIGIHQHLPRLRFYINSARGEDLRRQLLPFVSYSYLKTFCSLSELFPFSNNMTEYHCTCVSTRSRISERQDPSNNYMGIHDTHCPLYKDSSLLLHKTMLPALHTLCSNLQSPVTGTASSPSTLGMTKIVMKHDIKPDNCKANRKLSFEGEILFDWSRMVSESDEDGDRGISEDGDDGDNGNDDDDNDDDGDEEAWWKVLRYPSSPERDWSGNTHVCKDVQYMYVVWRCLSGDTPLVGHEPFCGGNLLSLFHLSHGVWVCHGRSVANNANNTVLEQMKRIWSSLKRCLVQREQYAELD